MELIDVINTTLPTLNELTRNEKFSYAVEIVKNSEMTYKNKLQEL